MKADTPPALLTYFLQEEMYLLKVDKTAYSTKPVTSVTAPQSVLSSPPTPVEVTPAITFKYLGGNQKKFLVITHYPNVDFIADMHLAPLTSTLGRINYGQDDIAILNLNSNGDATWKQLTEFFTPGKILILGARALPVGIPSLTQNIIQNVGTSQVLYTYSFDEMMGNKDNTKVFWNQIKTF